VAVVLLAAAALGVGIYTYQSGLIDDLLSAANAPDAPPASTAAAPVDQPAEPPKPTWSVNAEVLNLRGTAFPDGPIVGTVRRNMVVTEIDRDGTWIKVRVPGANGGSEGWINSRMLTPVKQAPQP
jgi:uncharacterized protein YgiM (DUF1202 family)